MIIKDALGLYLYIDRYTFRDGYFYNYSGELVSPNELDYFTSRAISAITDLYKTDMGKMAIDELQNSSFNYYIKYAETNRFEQADTRGAFALNNKIFMNDWIIGSGGTIYWNPEGIELFTQKGLKRNSTTDLAHELFHAMDANHGVMDNTDYNGGISKNEWQAVYNENLLRMEMQLPLRTYYRKGITENGFIPLGPRMTKKGKPIKPEGYN